LESLFSISPAKEKEPKNAFRTSMPKQTTTILDMRKANNTAIILAQFKLTPSGIRSKVEDMDPTITTEQLIALHSILTSISDQEIKSLNDVQPSVIPTLSTPDLFVYQLLQIPYAERRVRAWLVQRQMRAHIEDIENILDLVEKASNEVRASRKFSSLLKVILALGSVLNRGTYLSNTKGFRLDTLLRLGETKARTRSRSIDTDDKPKKQSNYSLLHYLAEVVSRDNPELLSVGAELVSAPRATGLGLDNAAETLADCQENLRAVQALLVDLQGCAGQGTRAFAQEMRPFAGETRLRLDALASRWAEINGLYSSLATYYGEDPKKLSTKDFFHIITEFVKSLEQAHGDNEKQQQIQRRRSMSLNKTISLTNLVVDEARIL